MAKEQKLGVVKDICNEEVIPPKLQYKGVKVPISGTITVCVDGEVPSDLPDPEVFLMQAQK